MVKSRRAGRASSFVTARIACPSPRHEVVQGIGPAGGTLLESPVVQRPLSRSLNYYGVRDELGNLTRLGRVLNYSDEQSSNNEADEAVQPATSPLSSSPSAAHISAHPEASVRSGFSVLGCATEVKAVIGTSASVADAALVFQRWRISSLKHWWPTCSTHVIRNVGSVIPAR